MVKSLEQEAKEGRFRRGIKRATLVASALLGLLPVMISCKNSPVGPNQKPTAEIYVTPNRGVAPFSAQIVVNGEDPDGQNDIKEYSAFADYNKNFKEDDGEGLVPSQSTPIDIPYTFSNPGNFKIYGKVVDSAGVEDIKSSDELEISAPPVTPPVTPPPVEPPVDPPTPPIEPPVDEDYLTVHGRVENFEKEGVGIEAIVEVLDPSNNSLGTTQTDTNGYFEFQSTTKKAKDLNEITLKATGGTSLTHESYTRMIRASVNKDAEPDVDLAKPVGVVSYPDLLKGEDFSKEDFKQYMKEVNPLVLKYNVQNVEITVDNPLDATNPTNPPRGSFTSIPGENNDEIDSIEQKVLDEDDIASLAPGKTLYVQRDDETTTKKHYSVQNGEIVPEDGWAIVVRDKNMNTAGTTLTSGSGGSVYGTVIFLKDPLNKGITTHEFGHSLAFTGHAKTLAKKEADGKYYANEKTIMAEAVNSPYEKPGFADKKAAKILYAYPGEDIENYLGLN